MGALYNLCARIMRRTLEIPSKGFPRWQTHRDSFDEELGVRTSGIVWLTNLRSRNFTHGLRYEPCSPEKCNWAMENSGIDPKEFVFIDIGCGKGRPLIIASQHHFAGLIGVDYSPKLCKIARANLAKLGIPAEVVCQDATRFQFPARDLFVFLYHPFDLVVLQRVLENLRAAKRVVVVYEGEGRDIVGEQAWLKPFSRFSDVIVYRNF